LKDNYYLSQKVFSPTKQKSNFFGATSYERDSSTSYLKEYESPPPSMSLRSNAIENSSSSYERMTFGKDNKYKMK
jgi:hypothetical protein